MPESQSENLKDLFRVAAGLPAAERGRYLEQACAGNSSLREKLESHFTHMTKQLVFCINPHMSLHGPFKTIS